MPLIGKLNDKLMVGLLFEAHDDYSDDPFLASIIKGYGENNNEKTVSNEFDLSVDLSHLLKR